MRLLSFATVLMLNGLLWASVESSRIALVVTLAGSKKLADYFEWSCRSIGSSAGLVDMLVFHENNEKVLGITCASNVKLINVGDRGLSSMITDHIIPGGEEFKDARTELRMMLSEILIHMPRYLVEIKPMTGTLFQPHLANYTHWSYTDPDILWGNLQDWIDVNDLDTYDLVSIAKNWDASRLYLRGQMTWHKNTATINSLWKELKYFSQAEYIVRIGSIFRLILDRTPTGTVFRKNCHSAEGWYSHLAFRKPDLSVKIVGRAFDDFFHEPLVLHKGKLHRCQLKENITTCHASILAKNITDVYHLPASQMGSITTYKDEDHCKMHWLPVETRYCIATPSYDKDVALAQDKQNDVKLQRMGEVALVKGEWKANNEMEAHRQMHDVGAFFHFLHWLDFITSRLAVRWSHDEEDCMVLYLRHDQVLAYESCSEVLKAEAQRAGGVELVKAGGLIDGEDESSVVDALAYYRKKIETGSTKRPRKEISSSSSAMESGILTKEEKMEKVRQARREAHKRNMARKTARQEKNQLRGHPAKK